MAKRQRRGRAVLAALGVAALGAAVWFYLRPVWWQMQITHARFAMEGVRSEWVATPEGRVHYYEAQSTLTGGGMPVVLVHGLGDRGEAWAKMIPRLRDAGFHVYVPDLLGFGRSPMPEGKDFSMAKQARLVEDFEASVGLEKPSLVGWSMGGWVAMLVAIDHPEMVDRVVVFDAAGVQYARDYPDTVFHPENEQELNRLAHLLEPAAGDVPHWVVPDAMRKFHAQQASIDGSIAAMKAGHDLLETRLPTMTRPLEIVWGDQDALLPLATVGELEHRLDAKSHLVVLTGCGHLVPNVCTSQAVVAVTKFLKTAPPPVGGEETWDGMRGK